MGSLWSQVTPRPSRGAGAGLPNHRTVPPTPATQTKPVNMRRLDYPQPHADQPFGRGLTWQDQDPHEHAGRAVTCAAL